MSAVRGSPARTALSAAVRWAEAWRWVAPIAAIFAGLSFGTAFVPGYGFMADELYFLSCADRLAWGYVDHPPFSIAVLAGFRALLGDSLPAVRLIAALFSGATVVTVGLLARELGGGKGAQLLAVLAWVAAPAVQAVSSYHSMNVIECFLWSMAALLVARGVGGTNARSWHLLGIVLGVALLNKLSTLWLGFGLGLGLVLTSERRRLRESAPWVAALTALVVSLPHGVWQVRHDLPIVDFIRGYGEEVAVTGGVLASPIEFVAAQLVGMSPFTLPLWLAGLGWYFFQPDGRPFRVLAWMWLGVFLTLVISGRGQAYYLTPAFPILYAAGAVWIERLGSGRRWLVPACAAYLAVAAILVLPLGVPILTPGAFNALQSALGIPDSDGELPLHLRWRVGWGELADAVREASDSLAPTERHSATVLATGFPAAGAIEYFGPRRGLPPVIGTHNSYWQWGPGDHSGEVMLIVAPPGHLVLAGFRQVEPGRPIPCEYCGNGMREEQIFVARRPIRPLAELWSQWRDLSKQPLKLLPRLDPS